MSPAVARHYVQQKHDMERARTFRDLAREAQAEERREFFVGMMRRAILFARMEGLNARLRATENA